jgi:hypothetical protein
MEPRTPPPHDPGTCADCFFSEADALNTLRCHRVAPDAMAGWPVVTSGDWCGYGYYNGSYYTPDGAKP